MTAMNKQIELICQHRELLVLRCGLQRIDLALQIERWKKPLSTIDHALALARRAREHSTLIARALAAFAIGGGSRLGRLVRLGRLAWRAYRLFIKMKSS